MRASPRIVERGDRVVLHSEHIEERLLRRLIGRARQRRDRERGVIAPAELVVDGAGEIRSVAVGYTTGLGLRIRLWLAGRR